MDRDKSIQVHICTLAPYHAIFAAITTLRNEPTGFGKYSACFVVPRGYELQCARIYLLAVAEWSRRTYPAPLGSGGVGSIPTNSDAQNVPSFRRRRVEMKLSPFVGSGDRFGRT